MVDNFYDIPPYYPEPEEELVHCDCCHECDSYRPTQMLDGYDGDRFFVGHKEQYLDNFKSDLSNEDYELLTDKINKQLK